MINKPINTAPAVAPESNDLNALLPAFRTFRGQTLLTLTDLYTFITTPSADRTRFVNSLEGVYTLRNNAFITQQY